MLNTVLDLLQSSLVFVVTQLIAVISYPVSSDERIFWLYVLSAAGFAAFAYARAARAEPSDPSAPRRYSAGAFLRFLFPKEVWRTPSAWLDVRYFFFHQIFRVAIYGAFLVAVLNLVYGFVTGGGDRSSASPQPGDAGIAGIAISAGFMIVVVGVVDFVSYVVHYLQHRIPLLWEFHKVHHSLEVMHPLSNYREHPIDNLAYAAGTGIVYGLFMGLANNQFGYVPDMVELMGIPVLMFAFNILGYNLRHSHVWVRWPGRWSMAFGSPAHHHVHHSCHPDHVDKNFAFMFPVWDVLFKTYVLPETGRDVRFGLAGERTDDYRSCLGLYFVPFRNIAASVLGGARSSVRS